MKGRGLIESIKRGLETVVSTVRPCLHISSVLVAFVRLRAGIVLGCCGVWVVLNLFWFLCTSVSIMQFVNFSLAMHGMQ